MTHTIPQITRIIEPPAVFILSLSHRSSKELSNDTSCNSSANTIPTSNRRNGKSPTSHTGGKLGTSESANSTQKKSPLGNENPKEADHMEPHCDNQNTTSSKALLDDDESSESQRGDGETALSNRTTTSAQSTNSGDTQAAAEQIQAGYFDVPGSQDDCGLAGALSSVTTNEQSSNELPSLFETLEAQVEEQKRLLKEQKETHDRFEAIVDARFDEQRTLLQEQKQITDTLHNLIQEQKQSTDTLHNLIQEQKQSTDTLHNLIQEQKQSTDTLHNLIQEQKQSTDTLHNRFDRLENTLVALLKGHEQHTWTPLEEPEQPARTTMVEEHLTHVELRTRPSSHFPDSDSPSSPL